MDLRKARSGQVDAVHVAIERIRAGERQTAIVLPTGYGKSDVIRMVAIRMWDEGLAACTLVLNPNEYLRQQLVSDQKWSDFNARYHPKTRRQRRYAELRAFSSSRCADMTPNGEFLLSATNQLITKHRDGYAEWVRQVVRSTGMPVCVVNDETHTSSSKNQFGDTLLSMLDAGAYLVAMTATDMREDGDTLVGFDTEPVSVEPVKITKYKPGRTPEKILVQIFEGSKQHLRIVAHHRTTFRQGWNEGVLCHINHHPFDMTVKDLLGADAEPKLLSDLSETETRKCLGQLVRHPEVVQTGSEQLVHWLRRVRAAAGPFGVDCAGLVFCSNDDGNGQVNRHAEEIRARIRTIDPGLKVVIATSADDAAANGKAGKSGKKVLEDFAEGGVGDILIVKQMAGVGVDAPRIKVVLDLSPVRTANSFIQRVNRATRPYNGVMVAHLVTPKDILTEACFRKFIEEEGGATTQDIEFVREFEAPKRDSDKPDPKCLVFHSPVLADVKDTKGGLAAFTLMKRINSVLEAFPVLLTQHTVPDVACKLDAFGPVPEPQEEDGGSLNVTHSSDSLRQDIHARVKEITKFRMIQATGRAYSNNPDDKAAYVETIKGVWNQLKGAAGTGNDFDYQNTCDVATLANILGAADAIITGEVLR